MPSTADPTGRKIVLVGNPNVGKSVIFRLLTGSYVLVSNFPGTTVEISRGKLDAGGASFEVIDTPGVGSMVPQSEDERVTCEVLIAERPDLIMQVADAKNLRRTLLVTSQLAEFRIPMVLVLNMMDEAEERGIEIDSGGLSDRFGMPVVETVAIYSQGRKKLIQAIQKAATIESPVSKAFMDHPAFPAIMRAGVTPALLSVEWLALEDHSLRQDMERRYLPGAAGSRVWLAILITGLALLLWNEAGSLSSLPSPFKEVTGWIGTQFPPQVPEKGGLLRSILFGAPGAGKYDFGLVYAAVHLLMFIVPVVVPLGYLLVRNRAFVHEIGIITRRASTGLPILLLVLLLVYEFVGYTGAQTLVGLMENVLFGSYLIPLVTGWAPAGFLGELLAGKYGLISMGLTYAIAIVLPVVATFFIAFGLMEDSGYLPRLAILSDRLMRIMGLSGKATLPMVLGLGCCTMATITTRILNSRKERLIATLLLALGIPCSAQLGVILGISASFSPATTLVVLGVVFSQLLLVGYLASRLIKGRPGEFIFEIPPIRVPQLRNVMLKTWHRVQWYLKEAVPLFLCGTLALFLLDYLHVQNRSLLAWVEKGLEPVLTGILDLPPQAASIFVLGFLRRDYGAAGLYDLVRHGALTAQQTVVSMVVITLFVPCLASFLIIAREHGLRRALAITAFIVPFAVGVGGALGWIMRTLNISLG
ncbi:MAG: small GTP-binding protein [Acidobacteria bacterium]|nr:small GTP-binding protein [Acidobacteriota bacterium]